MTLTAPVGAAELPSAGFSSMNTAVAQPMPAWNDQVAEHKPRKRGRGHGHGHGDRYDRYDRYDRGDYRNYGEPVHRDTRIWRERDGRYYCKKENGTTGLLIGAGVGGLIGHEVMGRGNDRTLGAILGAAGGALLGRTIDRSATRCR
ncbi:glycine zipper 2TM domain-containing protein [Altererythrobacter aurantiacus]|uniref:17 kDa surface antigen n=2 Tax=Parapontixanthobacter aurantiacus TaxID=1463599 RepID=A0A844ZD01_9SPHN|nr:glycine zipper 2TM domain-containing protein [Parapontixanthobacter aurantiacus]